MEKVEEISAFFPAYNEQENIEDTVKKAVSVLEAVANQYELIVVNDGSKDSTAAIVDRLAKENAHIRLITHPTNLGYGTALRSGFYGAKYNTIVFSDADGQFDFSEITTLLDASSGADLVIGYRMKRMDPPVRHFIAWGWKMLIWLFLGLRVRDVDCAFKLIKKPVLNAIPRLESTRGGMISPELIVKVHKCGYKIAQVGVHHYPRAGGKPKGVSIKIIAISFFELLKLSFNIRIRRTYKSHMVSQVEAPQHITG